MKKSIVKFAAAMMIAGTAHAGKTVYNGIIVNGPVASTTSYTTNVAAVPNPNGMSAISAQVIYSSVSLAATAFTDGQAATGTITVLSTNTLSAVASTNSITVPATAIILGSPATAQFTILSLSNLGSGATAQITIVSTSSVVNPIITVNGLGSVNALAGTNWSQVDTTSGTAQSLAAFLNAFSGTTGVAAAWGGGTSNVIYCTATVNGVGTNNYSVTSSTYNGIISTTAFSGGVANAYVTVNGNVLTNGTQWTAQTTTTGTAASLATAVGNVNGSTASWSAASVVYASATFNGAAGNLFSLRSSVPASISTSGVLFTGGLDRGLLNQSITFNGSIGLNGYQWTDTSNTSTGTAISIATWLQTFSVIQTTCVAGTGSVISATATVAGTAGNAYTLSASTTNLTVSGSAFAGGTNAATLTIGGVTYTNGTSWPVPLASSTTANLATAIAAKVNASSTTTGIAATAVSNTVTSTFTSVGTSGNVAWSSSNSSITVSNTGLYGGKSSSWTINSPILNVPNHGYATGLGVWFSSSTTSPTVYWSTGTTGATATAFAAGTTYYVIYVDANDVELSTSAVQAAAGAYITLISSSVTGAHTYTLNPSTYTATGEVLAWYVSDSTNCATGVFNAFSTTKNGVTISPTVISAWTNPYASAIWDFGDVDFQCLQLRASGPTAGEWNVQAIINGRD